MGSKFFLILAAITLWTLSSHAQWGGIYGAPNGYGYYGGGMGMMPIEPKAFDNDGLTVFDNSGTSADPVRWIETSKSGASTKTWTRLHEDNDDQFQSDISNIVTVKRNADHSIDTFNTYSNTLFHPDGVKSSLFISQESFNKDKGYYVQCGLTKMLSSESKKRYEQNYCATLTPAFCKEMQSIATDPKTKQTMNLDACANVQKQIAQRFNADNKNLDLDHIKMDFDDFQKNTAGEQFKGHSNTTLDMVNAGASGNSGDIKVKREEDFNRILGICMNAPNFQYLSGNQQMGMGMGGYYGNPYYNPGSPATAR